MKGKKGGKGEKTNERERGETKENIGLWKILNKIY